MMLPTEDVFPVNGSHFRLRISNVFTDKEGGLSQSAYDLDDRVSIPSRNRTPRASGAQPSLLKDIGG
jgi:hypothetical protein